MCWPVRLWLFGFFFSVCLLRPFCAWQPIGELDSRSFGVGSSFFWGFCGRFSAAVSGPAYRFRAGLRSLWPTLFISPARPSLLHTMQGASLPVFRHGSSPVSGIVSCICFQLCLGCCQLVFFSCRCVGIAAFLCLPSPLLLSPRALAWPFLAWWFGAPIVASCVFGVSRAAGVYVWPGSRTLSGNYLLAAGLGGWPTCCVCLCLCGWLGAPPFWMEGFWSPEDVSRLGLATFLVWTGACAVCRRRFVLPIPVAGLTCPNAVADHPTSRLSPGHSRLDGDLAFWRVVVAPGALGVGWILDLNSLLVFTGSALVFAVVLWLAPANVHHRRHRAWGPLEIAVFATPAAHVRRPAGDLQPIPLPWHHALLPPLPLPWKGGSSGTDVSDVSCAWRVRCSCCCWPALGTALLSDSVLFQFC